MLYHCFLIQIHMIMFVCLKPGLTIFFTGCLHNNGNTLWRKDRFVGGGSDVGCYISTKIVNKRRDDLGEYLFRIDVNRNGI